MIIKDKIKILMLGKPGGNLVRTYEWHIEALNNDIDKRFEVDDIYDLKNTVDIVKYDIFWFYAKAFHPNLYYQIKNSRPDAKIICGPNVLLDKPDIGPNDEWDMWYVNECLPDIHLDQVVFYSNHVKKFLRKELKEKARCLDKCMKIEDSLFVPNQKKVYDCLLYSKKRRYDIKFESFRDNLINLLNKEKINFFEIKAGTFGSYEREDYFDALNKSKVTISLSLDECPGILNYESMFFNVPVIGSKNNVPINSCPELYVKESDYMTEKYLVRTDDAAQKYFNKLKEFLSGKIKKVNHREFIKNHTDFQRFCNNVYDLLAKDLNITFQVSA